MKYIVTYSLTYDTFQERTERFLETGGTPPIGVEMHGRWHAVSGARGWVLASTDNAQALYKWIGQWADLMDFEVDTVLDDQEMAQVLQDT
jgi:hypothetical protein